MSTDDVDEPKGSETGQDEQKPASSNEDESGTRVDAAKAFFRAMYAGEEPTVPFGQSANQAQGQQSGPCRNCEALDMSLKECEQKAAELENLYRRMTADFENYRRRNDREREEAVSLGVKKAAEAFLPALDDLDRALMFLSPETPSEKVIESFQLVSNRIFACLEQVGLKPMNSIGSHFDPKYHEPVQQLETTEFPDGTVMQELRRGYMLHDKVVRPVLVNVASNSSGVVTPQAGNAQLPEMEIESGGNDTEEEAPENGAESTSALADEKVRVYDLGDPEES